MHETTGNVYVLDSDCLDYSLFVHLTDNKQIFCVVVQFCQNIKIPSEMAMALQKIYS